MNNLPPIVGTANIILAGDFVAPAAPPHTYLGSARALLNGVRVLAKAQDSPVALAMLAAQVAECSLKAYLSRGGNDKRLRDQALRHNLQDLWSLAHAEGLPIPQQAPDWLLTLHHLHGTPYYLRYSTGVHGLVLPAAEPMTTALGELVESVASHM